MTSLSGYSALVTSGPTHEPIDPVRFIGNYSSGKQGHAIAAALAKAGAKVTLVSGPVALPDPANINTVHVTTARDMLAACTAALPADIAVCAAAVADWRPAHVSSQKIKKNNEAPVITLTENPDILKTISHSKPRPALVIGFAAETTHVLQHAMEKRTCKGCDWIVANDVAEGVFGADNNTVLLITEDSHEQWQPMSKTAIAEQLTQRIATYLKG